jgi:hypothetical protein
MVIALPAAGAAIFAALLYFALAMIITYLIVDVIKHIPLIGRYAAQAADWIKNEGRKARMLWVDIAIKPLERIFSTPIEKLGSWMDENAVLFAAFAWWVNRLNAVKLDKTTHSNTTASVDALRRTVSDQGKQIAILEATIATLTHQVNISIPNDRTQAIGQATAAINNTLTQEQKHTRRQIEQAQATATKSLDVSNTTAEQLQKAVGALSDALDQRLGNIVGQVTGDVRGIENDVKTYLEKNLGNIAGDIATLTATLSIVQAVSATASKAIATYMKECGEPLCNYFKSTQQIGQELNQVISQGALWEMLIEIMTDPQAAATLFGDTIEPIAEDFLNMFRGLVK